MDMKSCDGCKHYSLEIEYDHNDKERAYDVAKCDLGHAPDLRCHEYEREDEHDTREKLEEDIRRTVPRWLVSVDGVKGWLDRQAAITERELTGGDDA